MGEDQQAARRMEILEALIDIYQAQTADLKEFATAMRAGEGTVNLERSILQREAQRAELFIALEQTALPMAMQTEKSGPPRMATEGN
jgi:hypothetical protein